MNEGIPELIATEFTGEHGPRAVHMGTVLRAWRRAGGSLRRPLEPAEIERVAREVDAGLVIDGSVIGLGSRLTLSATVIVVPGGEVRRVGSVSGPADSVEVLIGRLTSGLMAAAGTERDEGAQASLTRSPAAMRVYLEGMSLFRRGRFPESGGAFERALGLDTLFARAAFMRLMATTWYDTPDTEEWAQAAWALRGQLSAADRVLLDAYLGSRYPEPRTPRSQLADRERAVSLLPESPEAHFALADYLYHNGAANDLADHLVQARDEFERAIALDTQATSLGHLLEIGLILADTTLLQHAWPAYDRLRDREATLQGMVVAERTGDSTLGAAMARRPLPPDYEYPLFLAVAPLPAAPSGRIIQRLAEAWGPERLEPLRASLLVRAGRPTDLAARRRALHAPDVAARMDVRLVLASLFGDGDSAAAAAAVERLRPLEFADSEVVALAQCTRALWQLRTGGTPDYDAAFMRRFEGGTCVAALDLLRALRDGAPDVGARLRDLDSLVHWDVAEEPGRPLGFAHRVLARVWEARGDRVRALSAVRLRSYGFGIGRPVDEAADAREEGRLAALVGDTAGAVRAYRRYLDFRRDAEPVLVPQRDSVRAEVARLTASRRE